MAWEQQYEKTEKLVLEFKNGNKKSGDELITVFKEFINKYLEVICDNKINMSNYSIRKFISLYFPNSSYKKNVNKYRHASSIVFQSYLSINKINDLYSIYSKNDIYGILILELLKLAKRYTPIDDKPRFHAYLLKCYHFNVYQSLSKITKDALYHSIPIDDILTEITYLDDINVNEKYLKYSYLFEEQDSNVDDSWIAGLTCGDLFDNFSPVDRKILKLKYVDGLNDSEIGEELNVCRATINRKRIKIEKDIKAQLIERKCINI